MAAGRIHLEMFESTCRLELLFNGLGVRDRRVRVVLSVTEVDRWRRGREAER